MNRKRLDKARAKRDAKRRAEQRRDQPPAAVTNEPGLPELTSGGTVGQRTPLLAAEIEAELGFSPRAETRLGVILGGSRFEGGGKAQCTLDILDLDHAAMADQATSAGLNPAQRIKAAAPGLRRLSLGFLPHGMAVNPRRPAESAWFEKWGPGAAYLDVAAGSLLGAIAPLRGHHFYGHGAFSPDAARLFVVETNLETRDGVISVRDPSAQFNPIGEFPSFGKKPHDCVMLREEGVLVVTNGGGPFGGDDPANVSFIDVESGRLVEQLLVEDPRRNAGHVALDAQRNLAMVSAPRDALPQTEPGGVTLRGEGRAGWTHVHEPPDVCARMLGESLSVCIDPRAGTAWVTNPSGNLLSAWRVADSSLVRALPVAAARGVCLSLDQTTLCVSFAAGAELGLLDPDTGVGLSKQPLALRVFGGSHLYAWAYPT